MADKQTQARKRLLKKLSALRQTLRADERGFLDQLILGEAEAEVQAHRISAASKVTGTARPMISVDTMKGNYVISEQIAEVEAHRMQAAVTPKITDKIANKAAT